MQKFWKRRRVILLLFALVLLVYYPWRFLSDLVLRRESYIYLLPYTLNTSLSHPFYLLTTYHVGAIFIGWILIHLFGTVMTYYFQFEILVILIITVLLFYCVKNITKNIYVSFSSALLFSVNYIGNFEMYSDYGYSFFLERIITVPFLLISLLILSRALEENRRKYFIVSLVFFTIGIGLGHFALLFALPYCLYPFFWKLFHRGSLIDILQGIIKGTAFGAVALLFVFLQNFTNPGLTPKGNIFDFTFHPEISQYGEKILQQLVNSSQYPFVVNAIGIIRVIDTPTASALAPFIIVAYVISFFVIFYRLPVMRPLLFTVTSSTIGIFYLNVYWNRMLVYDPGPNRYLYFPSLLLAVYWSLLLWAFVGYSSWKRLTISMSCVAAYYLINVWGIEGFAHYELSQEKSVKSYFEYFMKRIPELKKDTVVLAPFPEIGPYEAAFFTTYVGNGDVFIYSDGDSPLVIETAKTTAQHYLQIKYNSRCNCVREEIIK